MTGLRRATVSRIFTRRRLNKIRILEPKLPPNRAAAVDATRIHLVRIVQPGELLSGLLETKLPYPSRIQPAQAFIFVSGRRPVRRRNLLTRCLACNRSALAAS
jgi:hypothetical protein